VNNKIININEISESRELLEKKPPKFITVLIYIFIIMMLVTLCWSYFGKKEIVVKTQGSDKSSQSNNIKAIIGGTVSNIKVKEGQSVKKDEELLSIDSETIKQQYEALKDTLEKNKSKLNALQKYEKSLNINNNLLSKSDEYEKEYYFKYTNYQSQISQSNNNISQDESKLNEVENQIEKYKQQIKEKQNQANRIEQQKREITLSKNSISNENSSLYNELEMLKQDLTISEYEKNRKIDELQNIISSNNDKINDFDSQLIELSNTKEALGSEINTLNGTISELELSKDSYGTTISNSSIDNSINKNNELITIQAESQQLKDQIDEYENQINSINIDLENYTIKSAINGKVHFIKQFNKNDTLSAGDDIIKINSGENEIVAEIYIPSTDIANINVGQKLKLHSYSLPYREYGFINSKISELAIDTSVSTEDGTSYYIAKTIIKNPKLRSSNGSTTSLKEGMPIECQIITGKKSYLQIFLEKLDLWIKG